MLAVASPGGVASLVRGQQKSPEALLADSLIDGAGQSWEKQLIQARFSRI
jgi:hypothetical protein